MRLLALILAFVTAFLFTRCGVEIPEGAARVAVKLVLPGSLEKESARYRRFLSRVSHLEIVTTSGKGAAVRSSFAPDRWEDLPLAIAPPADPKDALTIEARVWDRKRDGQPRLHPILVGHKRVGARELDAEGVTPVIIRLALMEGAAGEFD